MRKLQVKLSVFRCHCVPVNWKRYLAVFRLKVRSLVTLTGELTSFAANCNVQAAMYSERHTPKGAQEKESGSEQNILSYQGH